MSGPLPSSSAQPRHPTVLVIDDEQTLLDFYAIVLAEHYTVITANRGELGYTCACTNRPDIIVSDVTLPDVDGLDLYERFQANPATAAIPVVILTGDQRALTRALVRPNIAGVLSKPCSAEHLVATLRPLCHDETSPPSNG